MHHEISNFN